MKLTTSRFILIGLATILVAAGVLILASQPVFSSVAATGVVHIPVIRNDAVPTLPPTPENPAYSAAAAIYITRYKEINASTFNPSSIIIANDSLNGERLTELRIDLSTAIFPDMVFDPDGTAGDTVKKDVEVDYKEGLAFNGHVYESPHDGGFDVLVLKFQNFDRGDRFEFSVDVDPTSIRGVGAPGPFETGSVGGLELVGATITATFDDGTVLTNQAYRLPDPGNAGNDHSGAVALMRSVVPERPAISVLGVTSPSVVNTSQQMVQVAGPAGRPVVVMVVEGGLFTDGVPNGGFDLDPFEANTALTVREYNGVIGPNGVAEIPIVLSKALPQSGINTITAVFDNHYGLKGLVAGPLVLELHD